MLPAARPERAGLLEKIVLESWTAERVVREVALILTLTAQAPALRGLVELRRALPRLEKLSPKSLERAQALIDELVALR